MPDIEAIKGRYGKFFNMIYVRSDDKGKVIGHFTLYNVIAFQIVLAEQSDSKNMRIALVSNSLDPATWSAKAGDEFDIAFEWLDAPDFYSDDNKRYRDRTGAIMEHHFEVTVPRERNRIIKAVFRKFGIKRNEVIPPETVEKFSKEVARRLALNAMSLPHEEKMTFVDMQQRLARPEEQ